MKSDGLREILQVEHEIQARAAEEKARLALWLEGEKEGLAREYEARLEDERRRLGEAETAAVRLAEEQARVLVSEAGQQAARLAALDEAALRRCLWPRLLHVLREAPPEKFPPTHAGGSP